MTKKSVEELRPFMPEAFNNDLSLEVAFKEGYNFAVSNFGRLGGLSKSEKKAKAVRENGMLGGRPKGMTVKYSDMGMLSHKKDTKSDETVVHGKLYNCGLKTCPNAE